MILLHKYFICLHNISSLEVVMVSMYEKFAPSIVFLGTSTLFYLDFMKRYDVLGSLCVQCVSDSVP